MSASRASRRIAGSALILLAVLPSPALGQTGPDAVARAVDGLPSREIGPTIMGGRIADLAVVESDPATFYVGTASGGVWKTVNGGTTFEPVFDDMETASIGDVTVAPSNPNVVWVGTGEPQNRQSSPWGNGVYRSVDAGRSWTHLGLEDTHHIARIVVHPADPDVAYVAAVGHLWGPNEERGVYRTTDGGESWEKILYVDAFTGAIDLVMDPHDPATLFAATYQRLRRAWGFNGGGPGSGIWRTFDGGDRWERLEEGLPEGDLGRIGLDVYRGDSDMVFAIVEADARGEPGGDDGVYRSTDRGETWEQLSETNPRPMYYSQIRVDPNDPEWIWLGGADLYVSADGGRTFRDDAAEEVHLDHHALWIDPSDSEHMLLGSDGGVSVSFDRGGTWRQFRNLPVAQFYEIGVDTSDPYRVCGGLQDNGSWCAPSDTWSNLGIRDRDWFNVGSGDGFFTVFHPDDAEVLYAESQGGNLTRVNLRTGERMRTRPEGRSDDGADPADLRWNWNTPVMVSSHDATTVYTGANVLFRSTDDARTWEAISPDLTWAVDRDTLELMGVPGSEPMMSANDGQSSYGNLTALAESPLDADVLYTGADDGRLHVTRDGGGTWTDLTAGLPGVPPYTYVTRIVASAHAPGRVYVALDGHRSDDFAPYVFVSEDYGASWRARIEGLPLTSVNALAEHPRNENLLFVGNEVGVFLSVDRGARWVRIGAGLPTMPVDDIEIHPRENDLVLGTHGRGIWILDDITPLEELTADVLAADAHLFRTRPATSVNWYTPQGWTAGIWEAETPFPAARIRYHLATPDDGATLEVLNGEGTRVRILDDVPGEAGLHEVTWDLRLEEVDAQGDPMGPGPRVLPGTYTVRLVAHGTTHDTPLEVVLDPRVDLDRSALAERQAAMMASYRLTGPVDKAEEALEAAAARVEGLRERLGEADGRADALLERIDALEEELDDAAEGAGLENQIQSSSTPATADQLWLIERAWDRLPDVVGRINALLADDLPALEAAVFTAAARPTPLTPVPLPRREGPG